MAEPIHITSEPPAHSADQMILARTACSTMPQFIFSLHKLLRGEMDDDEMVQAALRGVVIASDALDIRT